MKVVIRLFSLLLLWSIVQAASAQETRFFMPLEIRQAYDEGTRSYDGRPGPAYWQNTADYTIEVTVDPAGQTLTGSEGVTYTNNSPNELNTLVVRLYYDVYKKANGRAYQVPTDNITDGVELRNISINGQEVNLANPQEANRGGTNLYLRLREPLPPGGKLTLTAEWSAKIPQTDGRTGAYDSTSFFVAYWYPQIAVYDDVFGWDQLSYTLRSEFYHDLANFDVRISAPETFTVWATGELQNAADVLPADVLERYRQAKTSAETVNVLTPDQLATGYRNRSGAWHYTAADVSDFAFALSDHYAWDAAAQTVDGRNVLISTVFPADRAGQYTQVTAIQQKSMKHFSEDMPGIPYPYPAFTTFIGLRGGGMEFPMMANNDGPGAGVTIHEMFHTYFPMYVRINEKRFAWMDEGWATFVTDYVTQRYFQNDEGPLFGNFKSQMQNTVGSISDLPLITSTQFMDGSNYGYASYPLPAFVYAVLHQHLGDEMFRSCLREYIRRWAKKSPTPYDFFYTFEKVSGQDLAWLWKPWFFEHGYPDLTIRSFEKGRLTVANHGNRPVPVRLRLTYAGGKEEEIIAGPAVWKAGNTYTVKVPDAKKVESISVNIDVPDATELDNFSPPLETLYAKFNLPAGLTGAYRLKEFPVTANVEARGKLLFFRIAEAGLETYLMPESDTAFRSLDGSIHVQFQTGGGAVDGIGIKAFGYDLTGKKE